MLVGDFPVRQTHWENQPVFSAIDLLEQAFKKSTQDPTKVFKRTLANAANAGGHLDKFTYHIEVQGDIIRRDDFESKGRFVSELI
jgi:hypothetical protein